MKKFVSLTAAVLILSTALCGCSSVKSAYVAARVGAAMKRSPITAISGKLHGAVKGKTLGIENTTGMDADFHTAMDCESRRSYTELQASVNLLGVKIPQAFSVYGLPEGESTACYVHVEKPSLWAKGLVKWDASRLIDLDPALIAMLVERASDRAEVNTLETRDGKLYQLGMVFSAEDLQEFLNTAGAGLPPELAGADLSSVTFPAVLEIDGDSYLPRRLELRVSGLDSGVLQALYRAAGREPRGTELISGELVLEITEFDFGPQTLPELPPEAETGAARMEELRKFLEELFS